MKNNKTVMIGATIKLMSKSEIISAIPAEVYDDIKKVDSSPMFAMMAVGYEGESTGELYDGSLKGSKLSKWYKQLWPLKAIKQLVACFKSGTPVPLYESHDLKNSYRTVVGSIVASTKKVIHGITHAVVIAYINNYGTRKQIESGEFDTCSVEAMCSFRLAKDKLRYIVDAVDNVSGVALVNSKKDTPGFRNANIFAVVTAMAKQDDEDDDDDDYEYVRVKKKANTEQSQKGEEMVTLREVQDFVKENQTNPTLLYKVEDLTSNLQVKGAFDADFQTKTKEKDEEIKTLNAKLKPYEKLMGRKKLEDLIRNSTLLKDEYKEVVDYLAQTVDLDLADADKPQELVDAAIQQHLKFMDGAKFKTKTAETSNDDDKNKGTDNKNKDNSSNTDNSNNNNNDSNNDNKTPETPEEYANPQLNTLIPR